MLPFIFFLIGYMTFPLFFNTKKQIVPCLIGTTVTGALKILTKNNLSLRMIAEREDPDVPAGTIISQKPIPGNIIKNQQTIFVVISKKNELKVPCIEGLKSDEYIPQLKDLKIEFLTFPLFNNNPESICLAQIPKPHKKIAKEGAILYVADNKNQIFVFPDFKNKSVIEVKKFLTSHSIPTRVYHTYQVKDSHICKSCKVKDQSPAAGTLLSVKKPFTVQLKV